ncbi:orphan G- coupled receptor 40 [Brachionus plicatilis]|uniref:Orphan G-coupled receptor 40 n=1 Tax=Brachionus plicatilis TaxID=10195 RepID=A0A3M7QWE7_BRAPC|nr:orphan G- coupled receptor 40 [Brachionus plicatilis]
MSLLNDSVRSNFTIKNLLLKLKNYSSNNKSGSELVHYSGAAQTAPDSKLLESINLLKGILDKLGKSSYDKSHDSSYNKYASSDSFNNLYALAKNSVTISFKDYLLLQKLATNNINQKVMNSTSLTRSENKYPSQLASMFNQSAMNTTGIGYPTTKYPLFSLFMNASNSSFVDYSFFDEPFKSNSSSSSLLFGIAFFYSILIITSLTSNPLLIYVLLWRRKAQIKLIDIFVANLSLSDLFLTIFNIPLCLIIYFSEQWPFGSLLCQIGTFSTSCSIYVNIFTMAYISIDRYFAVTRPLISNPAYQLRKKSVLVDNHTRHKIYLVLTLIWIIAIVLSFPQFLFSQVSNKNSVLDIGKGFNKTDYFDNLFNDLTGSDFGEDPFKKCIIQYPHPNMKNIMVLVNFSLQYLIPSIVILYFYGKIIYHLYLNLNVEELMESSDRNEAADARKAKILLAKKSKSEFDVSNKCGQSFLPLSKKSTTLDFQHFGIKKTVKKSRMRIEGLNRTRNLKKSIKTMIIIIALFLLSWLPIHFYRLATTFYPIVVDYIEKNLTPSEYLIQSRTVLFNRTNSQPVYLNTTMIEACRKNETYKDCLMNALKGLRESTEPGSLSYKINTLHNRYVFFFCYFMAMSSVCYNPIVYFWMHQKFRTEVKELFGRIFNFRLRREREKTRVASLITSTNYPRSSAHIATVQTSKMTKFSILSKNSTVVNNHEKEDDKDGKKTKKKRVKQPCYVSNIKIRKNRFSSLSSESTGSSSKRSEN